MFHRNITAFFFQMCIQRLCHCYATMHTTCTAYSYHKLTFSFLFIVWHKEIQCTKEMLFKFISHFKRMYIIFHHWHTTRFMTIFRNVIRVRQESYIPYHIRIIRHAKFKTKTYHRNSHAIGLFFHVAKGTAHKRFQCRCFHICGIDNMICFATYICQECSFL